MTILDVKHLKISFQRPHGTFYAVKGINFILERSETVGLIGESGSGKSVAAQALTLPVGHIESGEIYFEGENLLKKTTREMRAIRGKKIGMIFQDPLTALNPTMQVGKQIAEVISAHEHVKSKIAVQRALDLIGQVGISMPGDRFKQYPFQLSGGMRQRIAIAMAIACHPQLLIADEPTTALDVTVQAQIIDLLKKLQKENNMAILFITHDLGLAASFCDRILVMQKGEIVEHGSVCQIFDEPKHPYTQYLLSLRRHYEASD